MALAIAWAWALALALGAPTGADPPPTACTEIGCASGVYIQLERLPAEARSARVCVDGRCGRRQPLARDPGGGGFVDARLPKGKRRAGANVGVKLVLLDRDGHVVSRDRTRAKVRRSKPNGPDCPPTCFQVGLRYRGDRGLTP